MILLKKVQKHPHNLARDAFTTIDGFNQPNASPRFSITNLEIKHNAKPIGSDQDDIYEEFNLRKEAFIKN